MNFDATGDTFRGLLTSTRFYKIPRFQRDFSWEKSNNDELLNDIIKQVNYDKQSGFTNNKYYLGNMIFLGTKDKESVEVIDGQQRLTSGTILLAALRDSFNNISSNPNDNAHSYAETIQSEYLVKKIDGTPQRKLETTTTFPYFAETIQGISTQIEQVYGDAKTPEEKMLEETFKNFKQKLALPSILRYLASQGIIDNQKHSAENKDIYIRFIKEIRDAFLGSEIVEIFVADNNEAYRIFENINSKGKPLSQVDLIKNDIFSKISLSNAGVDTPVRIWKEINQTLSNLDTNFNEFFLHFWKARYPKDSANGNNLYKKYVNRFSQENGGEELRKLLHDIKLQAQKYKSIINPSLNEYKTQQSKSEYRNLDTINKLNVIQSRVPLLSLFIKREELELKSKKINEFLTYFANFHFAAFGTSLSIRGNLTTTPYKQFCSALVDAKNKDAVYNAMDELKQKLNSFIPKTEFEKEFIKLTFSKKEAREGLSSYPTSYAIKTIANKLNKRSFDDDEYSIEHIVDESIDPEITTNIGNLTVLEARYNNELATIRYQDKVSDENSCRYKQPTYEKCNYKMTNDIFNEYPNFNNDQIIDRAKYLANFFWDTFLS